MFGDGPWSRPLERKFLVAYCREHLRFLPESKSSLKHGKYGIVIGLIVTIAACEDNAGSRVRTMIPPACHDPVPYLSNPSFLMPGSSIQKPLERIRNRGEAHIYGCVNPEPLLTMVADRVAALFEAQFLLYDITCSQETRLPQRASLYSLRLIHPGSPEVLLK